MTNTPVVLADFPSGEVFGVWGVDPARRDIAPTMYTEYLDRDDAVAFAKRCGAVERNRHFYVVDTRIIHQGAQRIA